MALVIIACGYLLGSVPSAYLAARAHGVDIRRVGNGIAGATNVGRHVGRTAALLVGLVDVAKGAAAVLLALTVDGRETVAVLAGLAALVGHSWPVWSRFRGGLSAGSSVGACAALLPVPAAITVPFAVLAMLLARKPSPAVTTIFIGSVLLGAVTGATTTRVVGAALTGVFVLVRARTWHAPADLDPAEAA